MNNLIRLIIKILICPIGLKTSGTMFSLFGYLQYQKNICAQYQKTANVTQTVFKNVTKLLLGRFYRLLNITKNIELQD